MSNHNLRYYGLGSLTGLTIIGWLLDKINDDITAAAFAGIGALIVADVYKNRKSSK